MLQVLIVRPLLGSPRSEKSTIDGTGGSLVSYFQGFIDDLDTAGRFWDWKKYRAPQDLKVSQVSTSQVPAQPHLAFHKGQRVRTPEGDGEVLQYFRDRISASVSEPLCSFQAQ